MTTRTGERVITTACVHDCGGKCLLRVHLRDGVITRITGDEGEEPQLRPCAKGRAYRQRVYHPDRLRHPQKRSGKRGEGRFQRISWDEALETIAHEMLRIKEAYGPEAILDGSGPTNQSLLHIPTGRRSRSTSGPTPFSTAERAVTPPGGSGKGLRPPNAARLLL